VTVDFTAQGSGESLFTLVLMNLNGVLRIHDGLWATSTACCGDCERVPREWLEVRFQQISTYFNSFWPCHTLQSLAAAWSCDGDCELAVYRESLAVASDCLRNKAI
jgi:hypothetical protein